MPMSFAKASLIILAALLFSVGQACACMASEMPTDMEHMAHQDGAQSQSQTANHGMALCEDGKHSCGSFNGTFEAVLSPANTGLIQGKVQSPRIEMQIAPKRDFVAPERFVGLRWLDPPGVIATPVSLKMRLLN